MNTATDDKKQGESPDTLLFTKKKMKVRIYCDDIVFLESNGHNISIHMKDGSVHTMRGAISHLAEDMDKRFFVRVHRAYIVNLKYVYKVNRDKIHLYGMVDKIPVGRKYKQSLTDVFNKQHP